MADYREIITKAVVAKGRKFTQSNNAISPQHHPSSILGCWIINHKYDARKIGKTVEISGSFDVNVWFSHHDNTKTSVATEKIEYKDIIQLKYRDPDCLDDREVVAKVLQQPNCVEATISKKGNKIVVNTEREFLVEVIGETKICVAIHQGECTCEDDVWDEQLEDIDFEEINPDFHSEHEK